MRVTSQPELPRARRHFEADEAAADDRRRGAGPEPAPQMVAIGEVAQRIGQFAAFDGQAARLGAGGDQQLVVGNGASILQHHGLRLAVDADGPGAAHEHAP